MNNERLLYYDMTCGEGKIYCNQCGYSENIISFLHGFTDSKTGYQCQSCGKFHTIVSNGDNPGMMKCSCGGELDREKPLFCPVCKSRIVSFQLRRLT